MQGMLGRGQGCPHIRAQYQTPASIHGMHLSLGTAVCYAFARIHGMHLSLGTAVCYVFASNH
eukprot:1142076-Pelagomonas_calceolata.AAC.1